MFFPLFWENFKTRAAAVRQSHLKQRMKKLVIFASGTGTNADNIIRYFHEGDLARVKLIVSNKPGAGVLEVARRHGVPTLVVDRTGFYPPAGLLDKLARLAPDLIVLAGFLWKVPPEMVAAYPGKIINIHPALLPAHGGKGMYGAHVHEAVIRAKEAESGITIHYVNERYDEGEAIRKQTCPVSPSDTPETLAQKVHQLEYEWYPRVIEELLVAQKSA